MSWDNFVKTNLPTRKDERWKYADLSLLAKTSFSQPAKVDEDLLRDAIHQHRLQRGESILLVFANGQFMPALSDMAKLPVDVIADSRVSNMVNLNAKQFPFAQLNQSANQTGLFLQIPDNLELQLPIHLLFITIGDDAIIMHPQHQITLGENSVATIVEEYYSHAKQPYFNNTVINITVGQYANLDYYKIQNEGACGYHVAHTFVSQAQESKTSFMNISCGAALAHDDLVVALNEPGTECKTSGLYHLRANEQFIDNHVDINHFAPNSSSEMTFKGVLDNQSKAVFNGKLHVAKGAQKITAQQANHNLLLSNRAEVYSKPELEIYADDVKCKHGATTGQVDQEALFFLRARGIPQQEAMNMLLQGFADEVLQRINQPGVLLRAMELVQL